MADVVKAPALVVEIAAVQVQIPIVPATKMDVGMTPPTEGGPTVLTGREWKTSKMIAEPRLYKNREKKQKYKNMEN